MFGKLYESNFLLYLILLRKKLYLVKMKDVDKIVDHLNFFNTVVN